MLVICEDCAKKYNIDESRIKGRRARFTCNQCGHIIIVDKDDLTRSLLTGKKSPYEPTLDLLKEMEIPPAAANAAVDASPAAQDQATAQMQQEEELVKRKNRGIPVFVYFLGIMLCFLACVSLVFGYLYSGHLQANYLAAPLPPGLRTQLLLESSLIFGVAGTITLTVFCILSRSLHAKFRRQVENANLISIGEYDIPLETRGPQEIRDLGFALERIRNRLQAGRRRG
jgi:hypothetical protein